MEAYGGGRFIGDYSVVRRLGTGGMGAVYLCRTRAGQRLAVKVVREELAEDPLIRRRFMREVDALRTVHSPYTVPVYDARTSGPVLWLATRYLDGPTLSTRVQEYGPLSPAEVARLGVMLAEALATVHGRGIVHRDIKPTNIILEDDEPRLIDFGIARSVAASGLTLPGTALGTPGYMAPEQLDCREPTDAVDVFALGAVLAFTSTGRPPFGTGRTALQRMMDRSPPDLGGIPPLLAALIASCLAQSPGARPTLRKVTRVLTDIIAAADRRAAHRAGLPTEPVAHPAHRCQVPTASGACAVRPAAERVLAAGLTHDLIRKAVLRDDR
ncbi:serine/threonine-protein kinase [Streptomyces xanthii]|uniref:Serine/threonine protein kinase n=1 Tax=Streptomyces xanthii TaxID=2768069 RepID=A0A7H1B5B5_9ACTN|nr:serine/threonine-protein kinase [Streptomyces xanthii]QNS03920.1 serine/threonine protein kinase [Streptomyces xanthii]